MFTQSSAQDKRSHNTELKTIKKLLFHAVYDGNLEVVKEYFKDADKREIYINLTKDDGSTLLHWAVLKNHSKIVALLLINGADPYVKNEYEVTPIGLAEKQPDQMILHIIRDYEKKKSKESGMSQSMKTEEAIPSFLNC